MRRCPGRSQLDEDLLGIARHVRRPPVPNVLFAAVHFLLAEAPEHELSVFYGSLCTTLGRRPKRIPRSAISFFRTQPG